MREKKECDLSWLPRLLQVSDSAFPTGGYAHSYGFEHVVRMGLVHDEESLARHLENHLWPMLIHFEMPIVRFSQEAALKDDLADLIDLAECVEATKGAREIRAASRSAGSRRLHAFGISLSPVVAFAQAVEENRAIPHHAVVYGAGLASLPAEALLASWAFQSLNACCLSTPKLLRMGQDAAQRILTASLRHTTRNVAFALAVMREEIGYFDPLMEIASMQHEIADERLFIS